MAASELKAQRFAKRQDAWGPQDELRGCRPCRLFARSSLRPLPLAHLGTRQRKETDPQGSSGTTLVTMPLSSQGPPQPLTLTTPDNLLLKKLLRRGNWMSRLFQIKAFLAPE